MTPKSQCKNKISPKAEILCLLSPCSEPPYTQMPLKREKQHATCIPTLLRRVYFDIYIISRLSKHINCTENVYTPQDHFDLGVTLACSTYGRSRRMVSHFPAECLKTHHFLHLLVLVMCTPCLPAHRPPPSRPHRCCPSSTRLIATGFGSSSRSPRVTNESE